MLNTMQEKKQYLVFFFLLVVRNRALTEASQFRVLFYLVQLNVASQYRQHNKNNSLVLNYLTANFVLDPNAYIINK